MCLVLYKDKEAFANLGRVKRLQGAIEVWLDETVVHSQTPSCELSKATLQVRSILAPPQLIRLPTTTSTAVGGEPAATIGSSGGCSGGDSGGGFREEETSEYEVH